MTDLATMSSGEDSLQQALERNRQERDLVLAGELAQTFLPTELPEIAGYEFFAFHEASLEVGADYYHFQPLRENRLAILLGDVAGKGKPAALAMVRFSAEARVSLCIKKDLASAIRELDELMQPLSLADRFVTLAAVVLDPETHTASIVNAGHPAPLWLRCQSGSIEEAAPAEAIGPPIGVLGGYPYEAHQVLLQPGDNLLIYSKGLLEIRNPDGHPLGEDGLRAVLAQGSVSPKAIGERIVQAVKAHTAGVGQRDDITLVCLGRLA